MTLPDGHMRSLRLLTLEGLIKQCCTNRREAWEEFFRRFHRLIQKTIRKVLIRYDRLDLSGDEDVVEDIFVGLAMQLLEGEDLAGIREPEALPKWLTRCARNYTIDWLRSEGRRTDVLRKGSEQGPLSLEQLSAGYEFQGATALSENSIERALQEEETSRDLELVLSEMENLRAEDRLILRAILIFYEPLDDRTIQEIAERRQVSQVDVHRHAEGIREGLFAKHQERYSKLEREGAYWHELRKLEAKQLDLKGNPGVDLSTMDEMEAHIESVRTALANSRGKGKAMIQPKMREVAELVGLSAERVQLLSLRLLRARRRLMKVLDRSRHGRRGGDLQR